MTPRRDHPVRPRRNSVEARLRPRRRTAVAATAAATALALTASACSQNPVGVVGSTGRSQPTPAPITPAAARQFVARMMVTNNRANKAYDSQLLGTFETGSAFTLDDAGYVQDRLALKAKDPLGAYQPFTVEITGLGVPRHGGSRARWIALGNQHLYSKTAPATGNCVAALVFQRSSGSTGWHLSLEPNLPAGVLPKLAVGSDGYQRSPSAADLRNARAVPGDVVKALMAEETSGTPGPFQSKDFSRRCGPVPNPRMDVLNAESSGFGARDLFSLAHPTDTVTFPLAGRKDLVMFTLHFDDQVNAASAPIHWTQSATKTNPAAPYEYLLSAGNYANVSETGLIELAAVVSQDGSYQVVGSYYGVTGVTGVKWKGSVSAPHGTLTDYRRLGSQAARAPS